MDGLATILRAAQLYAHAAHHLVNGPSFFGDHEFFGDTYEELEGNYDDVIEQCLANNESIDFAELTAAASELMASSMPTQTSDPDSLFSGQQELEVKIRKEIAKIMPEVGDAAQGLIQSIAQSSMRRSFKILARLK